MIALFVRQWSGVPEKAEHIMLVDLSRNDISKVCDTGTVKVTDFMTIERYSHVMHIAVSYTHLTLPTKA